MDWTITLNKENQYYEVITSGIADKFGSLNMAKSISITLSQTKIKKILIDHRNISEVSGKILDIYNRPKEYEEIGVIRGIRIAEIVKAEHKEFFNFLETVCVNRGFSFATFEDKTNALEWLLKV